MRLLIIINNIAILFYTPAATATQLIDCKNALGITLTIIKTNMKWEGVGAPFWIKEKYTFLANKLKFRSDGSSNHLQTI